MKKFKTAIIGVGFIGVAHIEALRRLGNIEIVAISDPFDAELRAKELHIARAYTDYKKLIKENKLDFIHICTPNNTHYEIASYAIKHGINVVLEKPMTLNANEAKKLVNLAKEHQVIAALNYHNRMYPIIHHLKHMIKNQTLGDVVSVTGAYMQDWLHLQTDFSWRLISKTSGKTRAVSDIGSHWLDLMEYITEDQITEVLAEFKTVYPQRKKAVKALKTFEQPSDNTEFELIDIDTEDIAIVTFKTQKGVLGNVVISQMVAGTKNRIHLIVSGTKASAEWSLEDLSNLYLGHRNQANEVITKDSLFMQQSAHLIDYPSGHMEGFPDAFKHNFKMIYNQAIHPDTIPSFATFKDGYRQMILDDAIYKSAKNRKWIEVK